MNGSLRLRLSLNFAHGDKSGTAYGRFSATR
jgi:hypothetical protein